MIPLGVINGGLGLHIAGASSRLVGAYAAVAAVMGGLWILVSIMSEARRARGTQGVSELDGARGKSPVGRHRPRDASHSSYSQ